MGTRKLLALLAVSVLSAAFLPARSESEPAKKDDPCKTTDGKKTVACTQQEEAKPKPVAFTNDDLEQMFGPSKAPAVSVEQAAREKGGAQPNALGAMREDQQKAAATGQSVELAKAKLAEAEKKVKDLEARNIQIANPLLPRPQLSPEEQKAWAGMDNVERMKQNQAAIDQAKHDAELAKQELERAQSGGQ